MITAHESPESKDTLKTNANGSVAADKAVETTVNENSIFEDLFKTVLSGNTTVAKAFETTSQKMRKKKSKPEQYGNQNPSMKSEQLSFLQTDGTLFNNK